MTIVDDDLIEYDETHYFFFYPINDSIPFYQFYDETQIFIRDNEDTKGQQLYKIPLSAFLELTSSIMLMHFVYSYCLLKFSSKASIRLHSRVHSSSSLHFQPSHLVWRGPPTLQWRVMEL